jgi:hypothetical protein
VRGYGHWRIDEYAIYWQERYSKIESRVRERNLDIFDILGEKGSQEFRCMREFSRNVGDILATVADIRQPRSFDDLMTYGFDG